MTPKETGSFDDDWSEISGHREKSGAGAGEGSVEEVPPWAEALACADPDSHPTVERMDSEEENDTSAAGDRSDISEELDGEEGGNAIALIASAKASTTEEENTSSLAGAETEETVNGPASAGMPSTDLTDVNADVNADAVPDDIVSAGNSVTPATSAEATDGDEKSEEKRIVEDRGTTSKKDTAPIPDDGVSEIDPDAGAPTGAVSSAGSEPSAAEDGNEAEETHWTKLSVDEFDVPPLTDWTRAMIFAGNDHETPRGETAGLGVDDAKEKEGEEGSEEVATKDAAAARVVENLAAFVGHKDTLVDVTGASGAVPKNKYGVTTPTFGGGGGGPFNDAARPYVRISSIAVNAGALIDGISIKYSDGTTTKHGGEGGGWRHFPLVGGESVVEVCIHYGRFVQSLEFRTSMGRTFGPLGEGGFVLGLGQVREATIKAPEGHILAGIHGREGKYIDGIGFHWAPAVL